MTIVFIRACILYCVLIFSVRLMGKRQIGELQPSELAITILISNIATLPVEDLNVPLVMGLLPILTLVSLDVVMSWVGMKSGKMRRIMSGEPVIVISDGKIDQQKLYNLRFSTDDLMEAVRAQGIFDINEVQFAIVETTGKVNIMPKFPNRNVTNEDMGIKNESTDPPAVIVQDGQVMLSSLKRLGLGEGWLDEVLKDNSVERREIFMMTAQTAGKYTIIKKELTKAADKGVKYIDKS
ncbi:MAG: DUF421 domain-containing protein [Oscillospiraceae bacterium]|nr:DUF421 domain-containing protein [Oscillospiraceae bacterium]